MENKLLDIAEEVDLDKFKINDLFGSGNVVSENVVPTSTENK